MKILKRIYQLISWSLVLVTIFLVSVLILSKMNTPIKVRVFSILSGSMEPQLPTGSLVFVQPQSSYEVGDMVTVAGERGREAVTHRITQINRDQELNKTEYVLKGDANDAEDREPVSSKRVIGKVFWNVPRLGRIVSFAQSELGFITLIVIPATVLIVAELMTLKSEIEKYINNKKSKKIKREDEVKTAMV